MSKDSFKIFVKKHPSLINYVKNNEMTWQKFYEIYDIYGNNNEVWDKYFNSMGDESSSSSSLSVSELIDMVKKVDLNNVQKNITNISKALALVQSLITKEDIDGANTYTPRPLYKKFED